MSGLPKSIIKKYGVTKKAWAVYRGQSSSSSRSSRRSRRRKIKTRSIKMVRRKSYHRRRSSSGFGSMKGLASKVLVGVGVTSIVGGGILGLGGAFLLGGIPAVAGAFLAPKLSGIMGGAKISTDSW